MDLPLLFESLQSGRTLTDDVSVSHFEGEGRFTTNEGHPMKNILLLLTILIASNPHLRGCGDEGAFRDAPDTLHPAWRQQR